MGIEFFDLNPETPLYNNLNNDIHYRTQKSRDRGELELRDLTRDSYTEEAWVYVKIRNQEGNVVEYWYEIGFNEDLTSTGMDISAYDLYNIVSGEGKILEWSLYHTHLSDESGKSCNVQNAIDVEFAVDQFVPIFDMLPNNIQLDSRAVSSFGVSVMTPNIDKWRTKLEEPPYHLAFLPYIISRDFYLSHPEDVSMEALCFEPADHYHKLSTDLVSYSYYAFDD